MQTKKHKKDLTATTQIKSLLNKLTTIFYHKVVNKSNFLYEMRKIKSIK